MGFRISGSPPPMPRPADPAPSKGSNFSTNANDALNAASPPGANGDASGEAMLNFGRNFMMGQFQQQKAKADEVAQDLKKPADDDDE